MTKSAPQADLATFKANAADAAAMLRALGNERRLLLLCQLIEQRELTAGELADSIGLSPSATSQHLAKMREEGLVSFRREAQTVYYRIADANVKRIIGLLKSIYCT